MARDISRCFHTDINRYATPTDQTVRLVSVCSPQRPRSLYTSFTESFTLVTSQYFSDIVIVWRLKHVSERKEKVSYLTQSDKFHKKNYFIWGVGTNLLYFN